ASRRRHTRWPRDWSSDVCSSDLEPAAGATLSPARRRTLELELQANLALADDKMSSEGARRMAAARAAAVQKLLALPDTAAEESRDRKSGVEGKGVECGGGRSMNQ